MPGPHAPLSEDAIAARRRAARRTAIALAAVAVVVYLAFIASGVVGR